MEDLMKAFIIKTDERLETHSTAIREQGTAIRNLKRHVGQLSNLLSKRVLGTPPANIERNPKETINTVCLRSGQVLKDPIANKRKQRREKLDKQFGHFLEVLKQVHVNLPFTEILSQMPAYANFLKEILSNKCKEEETSVVKLTEHCSAILQNKLHQKKLEGEIGEIKSIPFSLQLEDQTIIIPEETVEDVLVRVDKFVFLVYFIVVNMEENKEERQFILGVGEEMVVFKMEGAMGEPRYKLIVHSEFKTRALKERAGESKHDKCGVYPKKA
ncbi:PREDICTED: uncharacterized protein LOC109214505 [Nicotiana attenuata]|uniref:uncharacterized protein LOC109214505 n=1 Tax=Nicotiana attenuata TaxID=49451 RepID=UPI00090526D4|nr:PREDICTED: uncharacterized protein LOC109214505 [Nicotiana attenuata]